MDLSLIAPMLMSRGRSLGLHLKSNSIYYAGAVAGYMGALDGHTIPLVNREATSFLMMFGVCPFNVRGDLGKVKSFAQGYTFGKLLKGMGS